MERILVDPWKVWDFCPFVKPNPDLEKRVKREGFANVPPVVGFELPPEYKGRFHYILGDGNYRRDLAAINGLLLPFLKYEPWEPIHVLDNGDVVIDPTKGSKLNPIKYERMLFIYLNIDELHEAAFPKKKEQTTLALSRSAGRTRMLMQ